MKWSSADLVEMANYFAMDVLGCPEPPGRVMHVDLGLTPG